jgi:AraC-like DNA-binding protein
MIQKRQFVSILQSPYEMFFENGAANPAGDLLAAGVGLPVQRNNWLDTRNLWSYPYYTLCIILGEGKASFRNETGFKCALSQGNFFLTFPDVKQQFAPAVGERWGELCVCFAGELFDVARKHGIISPDQPVWRLKRSKSWIERLRNFAKEPLPPLPQNRLLRAVHFLDILAQMMENATPVQDTQPDVDWFYHACNLLTHDLHHEIDLHAIADELEMTFNTFRIYFKRRAGISPIAYRNQARLRAASVYLAQTPVKPCAEVAFIVGYSCQERFSKHFKKYFGLSPLAYRKKHMKG